MAGPGEALKARNYRTEPPAKLGVTLPPESLPPPGKKNVCQHSRDECQSAYNEHESLVMLREWYSTDVHPEQPRYEIDG